MGKITSYIQNLTLSPREKQSLVASYLSNMRLFVLFLIFIVGIGIWSFLSLPRNLNPDIKIPIVLVSTVIPGASPLDVEQLVTVPIEDAIEGVAKVKQITSSSRDSFSLITVEFETGVDPEKARTEVHSAVDGVVDLPEDAKTPQVVKLDFENQPVYTFALTGKDSASLSRFATRLKDELQTLSSLSKIEINGLEEQEVQIYLTPAKVASYRVAPFVISSAVSSALQAYPLGSVRTQQGTFSFTIDPQITSIDEIRSLPVSILGTVVQLSDIATVSLVSKPSQMQSYFIQNGTPVTNAVTVSVYRRNTVNIDTAVTDTKEKIEEEIAPYKGLFAVHVLENVSDRIDTQFGELQRDFLITIVLVFVVLFVFLGVRPAIVSIIGAPFAIFITFFVMNALGLAINFIAFFSLLIALGLLVDDTIVVISAMTSYYKTGKFTPLETALLVFRDFWVAVFTTTLTTVFAFLPLLLSSGIIGEFIKPIPIIVSTTLMASFVVAMGITIPFMVFLLRPIVVYRVAVFLKIVGILLVAVVVYGLLPKDNPLVLAQLLALFSLIWVGIRIRKQIANKFMYLQLGSDYKSVISEGLFSFSRIERIYQKILKKILATKNSRRKAVVMVVLFFVFSFLLVPLGFVKNEFFPKTDENTLYLTIEMPSGTYFEETKKESLLVLEDIQATPFLDFATLDIGKTFSSSGQRGGEGGGNVALITIHLQEKRKMTSFEIATHLRNQFESFDKGSISVAEESSGPPAGADVQIKFLGDDLSLLSTYASAAEEFLKKQKGVSNVNLSVKPGTSKVVFVPDPKRMAEQGISRDTVGLFLRTYTSGFSVDTLKMEGEKEGKDITIRFVKEVPFVESLSSIQIPMQNKTVSLSSLGVVTVQNNPTVINREEGKRTLSVSASVAKGYSIPEISAELEKYVNTFSFASGYSWKTGGVNEENQKSVQSILQAMALSFLLIVITMVLQFTSFRRAVIVMLVIPLSISGVFIMFALTNTPLSFPALIGVLALFGIVVKNSILIVDKIIQNQKIGMDLESAIIDASTSRLEAIALTSFCTIAGLIPITLSDPIWRGLGGAIIAGLTFSGTIMLFFIPVVYYMWFQKEIKPSSKRDYTSYS